MHSGPMRAAPFLAAGALVAGVALLADAVARGDASLALVVVFPVLTGSSAEFLGGTILLVAGIFALPFALAGPFEHVALEPADVPENAPKSGTSGGLLLVGPVPIFFGSWRGVSRRTRWVVALVGAAVTIGAIVALVLVG